MIKRSIGTARVGGFKALPAAAFLALGLLGAIGCAVSPDPSISVTPGPGAPAPSATTTATPAPSATAPAPAAINPAGTGQKVSVQIDNSMGGAVALPDGTKIEVPAGALPIGVDTITITSSPAPAPTEYAAASPMYVFGPDGTVFLKPLTISVPFTIPAGKATSDMTILWSRATGDGFDMVPSTFAPVEGSATAYIATGSVTHFSRGFCGAKFATDPHPAKDPYQE